MLYKTNVKTAAAEGRIVEVEIAFRALVDWPRVELISGLNRTDEAMSLLEAVCRALVRLNDTRPMAPDTIELLNHMADGPKMFAHWYSSGASFVLDQLEQWRPIFARTFGEAGTNG